MRRGARAARKLRVFKRTIPQQLQYAPVDPASLGLEDALRECLRREETRRPGYHLWERDGVWPPPPSGQRQRPSARAETHTHSRE